jgi:glycosyltransferase involved in cell wall biosynthesis
MAGRTFAIVQEYVPAYRVRLFELMAAAAAADGDELRVYAGAPAGILARRRDGVESQPWLRRIRQREFQLFGRRITIRVLPKAVRRADLIVLEQARRNVDLPLLLLWPGTAKKVAMWGHGEDVVKIPSRLERQYSVALLRRAAWFFSYTQAGADWAKRVGVDRKKSTVLRNSIDVVQLRRDLEDARRLARHEPMQAAFIGGLDASKRISELIEIAVLIKGRRPAFRLVVVGDGELRDSVLAACQQFDWIDYRGPLAGVSKAQVLLESDVLLLPGRVGLVALDSLVAGRPIVTLSDSLHAPEYEYLDPGGTCLIAGSLKEAAQKASALLADREALEAMQVRCREAAEDFSVEEMAGRFNGGLKRAVEDVDE